MKLKVCGMKYQENMIEVAKLQPDYLGFIFYEKSSRFFEGTIPKIPKSIKKVGVFVDASIEFIIEKVKEHQLQAIQLHGTESVEYCEELKRHYEESIDEVISPKGTDYHVTLKSVTRNDSKVEIIKVFSIKDAFNFEILKSYENVCDYFLFDTKGKLPGGNGFTFNWNVLKEYPSQKPYFLSGGIGLNETENLKSFFKTDVSKYCYAIDVNSKFEVTPGLKNSELIKEFKSQL
jgi:phosphoribosylanthranilate isomerase